MLLLTELCALFLSIIVGGLSWYFYSLKRSNCLPDNNQAINVIKIIEALEKLCPVGPRNNWILLNSDTGSPRCWSREFHLEILNSTLRIFGCSVIVKTSSLAVLQMVANTKNWAEWVPMTIQELFSVELLPDKRLRDDDFMRCAKVVNKSRNMELYRFSHLTPGNLGWVLLWNVKKLDCSFYLVQPLNKSELDHCMLTHIFMCYPILSIANAVTQLTLTVNAIKEAAELRSVQVIPIHFPLSSTHQRSHTTKNSGKNHAAHNTYIPMRNKKSAHLPSKTFKLVPYAQSRHATIRNFKGFALSADYGSSPSKVHHIVEATSSTSSRDDDDERRHKAIPSRTFPSTKNTTICKTSQQAQKFQPSQSGHKSAMETKSANSDTQAKMSNGTVSMAASYTKARTSDPVAISNRSLIQRSHTVSLDCELRTKGQKTLLKERSLSDADLRVRTLSSTLRSDCPSLEKLPECDEDSISFDDEREDDSFGEHSSHFEQSMEDSLPLALMEYEILLPDVQRSGQWMTDVLTSGNYSASELQAEVLEASSINLQSSIEDQSFSSRGWMFHSIFKGLTVLTKAMRTGPLRTLSYMCETNVLVKPLDVWNAVRNPHLRFICDETVKKVRILEEISSDQKIVYTYHEAHHYLKKEATDYCMLHTERRENSKYYLAIQSIEYDNCPLMDSITRGTLLPSGWVIRPFSTDEQSCKVAYLCQVVVNKQSSFQQDLSTLVPLAVYNLKKYVSSPPS